MEIKNTQHLVVGDLTTIGVVTKIIDNKCLEIEGWFYNLNTDSIWKIDSRV